MNRRTFLASGATLVTGALAGCPSGSAQSTGEYDVGMSTADFRPATLTVAPGTTVVWKNTSSSQHTVTAYGSLIPDEAEYFASGGFESQQAAEDGWIDGEGGIVQGETYKHTFEVPGTYQYYCIPHEPAGMKGTVVVSESTTTG